jgi:exopolysaccharide production protein ExoQ
MVDEGRTPRGPRLPEKTLTVLILFALTRPFFSRAEVSGGLSLQEDGLSGNLLFAFVYGTILVLLMRGAKGSWRFDRVQLLLLGGVVGVAVLSTIWSIDPYRSLRAGLYLGATTLAGVYLASRYSKGEQVELVGAALSLAALASLLVGLEVPSYGLDGDGEWRGVFRHKNHLGRLMALATIVYGLLALRGWRGRWLALGGVVMAGALVLLSGSSTALVVVACVSMLVPFFAAVRAQVYLTIAVWSVAILLAGTALLLFLNNPAAVLNLLHRDATLTGRTPLWEAVGVLVSMRPWLGYGYQAFWTGDEGSAGDVWEAAGWSPVTAHNGFLELGLSLGIVGLALFSLAFLLSFWRAWRDLRQGQGLGAMWPAIFLSYFLLYNLTESSLLLTNNILWVLYVATTLSLHQGRAQGPKLGTKPGQLGVLAAQRKGKLRHAVLPNDSRDRGGWRPVG